MGEQWKTEVLVEGFGEIVTDDDQRGVMARKIAMHTEYFHFIAMYDLATHMA